MPFLKWCIELLGSFREKCGTPDTEELLVFALGLLKDEKPRTISSELPSLPDELLDHLTLAIETVVFLGKDISFRCGASLVFHD